MQKRTASALASSVAMMRLRSAAVSEGQAAISAMVRWHPRQVFVAGSSWQIPAQGVLAAGTGRLYFHQAADVQRGRGGERVEVVAAFQGGDDAAVAAAFRDRHETICDPAEILRLET